MLNRGGRVLESHGGPTAEPDAQSHLTESQLAGYLDCDLRPEERLHVEFHLDACAACRGELAEIARIAASSPPLELVSKTSPRSPRRWWPIALSGALAAGLAGVLLFGRSTTEPSLRTEPVRAPVTGEGRARIEVIAPAEDASDVAAFRTFTWHRSGAGLYRFILLSESGEPLWTRETPDTSLVLPASVSLQRGHDYFWRVDAVGDGVMASTGARSLRVPP